MPAEPCSATVENIERAGAFLQAGRLVAFPTETVYGLGADATDDRAVAGIFEAKGRPSFNPLIVHVPDETTARLHVHFTPEAAKLAAAFWPGGLTLVLPRKKKTPISLLVSAGLDTIAIRVPDHDIALAMLRAAARPIAAPSANASGKMSPTEAGHVIESLGHSELLAMVLDAGSCRIGLESTVVGFPEGETPVLLRPGAISREEIELVLGRGLADAEPAGGEAGRSSPGQLASHYAPDVPVRLDAVNVHPDEVLLAFGYHIPESAHATLNLSPSGDLREAAANLFTMLRTLNAHAEGRTIAVMPIPHHGLGAAINDRLKRAAAPRT